VKIQVFAGFVVYGHRALAQACRQAGRLVGYYPDKIDKQLKSG
jgi:hypothetical protein